MELEQIALAFMFAVQHSQQEAPALGGATGLHLRGGSVQISPKLVAEATRGLLPQALAATGPRGLDHVEASNGPGGVLGYCLPDVPDDSDALFPDVPGGCRC